MSFQAHLENIEAKTGMSADDFRKCAEAKGLADRGRLRQGVKAGEILKWLKDDFALGPVGAIDPTRLPEQQDFMARVAGRPKVEGPLERGTRCALR